MYRQQTATFLHCMARKKERERRARQELRTAAPRDRAVLGRQRLSAKTEQMRSCARMSARGWPKLRRGRGGRGVAHRIGVPPVRLFGGRILPPAVFRRCCRVPQPAQPRYFWRRSESASAASTRRRRGARAQDTPTASCCWSCASIAARPPDRPESSAKLTRVDSGYCPLRSIAALLDMEGCESTSSSPDPWPICACSRVRRRGLRAPHASLLERSSWSGLTQHAGQDCADRRCGRGGRCVCILVQCS